MFSTLLVLGLLLLTQFTKKYIVPKWGQTGVHVFIFLIAAIVMVIKYAMTSFPGFEQLVIKAGEFLVATIAVYEVVLKQILDKIDPTPPPSDSSTADI